ncbi:hypothetical protein LTR16_000752 [Cryomyces antarcticus]|uniref:CUE domain-containing protein n=1 Tax=Cryomyces antarcticus TaxID=329879 RepID=A0ABR0M936_9PEZI|nr:hypothetical protein LTR60_000816 [Cryomyces antarcticus]KAK5295718.1 hypothetical protein LTR16_000752 [Cryomyces antarcticus]
MNLPAIAPFPPAKFRRDLVPEEWEACLDAWLTLTEAYLRLPPKEFVKASVDGSSLVSFLTSYYHEVSRAPRDDQLLHTSKAPSLRKMAFLLTHRILSTETIPASLLRWTFLVDISQVYPRSKSLQDLLHSFWIRRRMELETGCQKLKDALTKALESEDPDAAASDLRQLAPLLHVSPDAGLSLMTGSDFVDAMSAGYQRASSGLRPMLVTVTYLGLTSLIKAPKPNHSLLFDHLYSLKASTELQQKPNPHHPSLLSDLVTNTPILQKLRDTITGKDAERARDLSATLGSFRRASGARPKRLVLRKMDKGKGRIRQDEYGHGAFSGIHVHRMSLVSQVQDLFPDLGAGFIIKLMDEYNDDVEQVTAHLLEDSLPPHLRDADRTEDITSGGD